uniref:Uncharacterized protein n=1 Tax=Acrobeloides nanus TaxID=290746 RepID=A0A914BYH2_9BILA
MNDFNSIYCSSGLENERCTMENSQESFFFNKTCYLMSDQVILAVKNETFQKFGAINPTEEFFENYVLEKTATMEEIGGINWKLCIALAIAWLITALVLVKGVAMIGRAAVITATVPYVIITILFIRSGVAVFSTLGFVANQLNMDIKQVVQSGLGLAFVAYPEAMSPILLLMEISLVMYIYGCREYMKDLRTMFGDPKHLLGKFFGPSGHYIRIMWTIVSPVVAIVID